MAIGALQSLHDLGMCLMYVRRLFHIHMLSSWRGYIKRFWLSSVSAQKSYEDFGVKQTTMPDGVKKAAKCLERRAKKKSPVFARRGKGKNQIMGRFILSVHDPVALAAVEPERNTRSSAEIANHGHAWGDYYAQVAGHGRFPSDHSHKTPRRLWRKRAI